MFEIFIVIVCTYSKKNSVRKKKLCEKKVWKKKIKFDKKFGEGIENIVLKKKNKQTTAASKSMTNYDIGFFQSLFSAAFL